MTANNGRDFTGSQCDDTCTVDCGHCKGDHTRYSEGGYVATVATCTRCPQPPRATVQDIRQALRGVLSEYQAVDNTPDLLHSVMLDKVAELVQDVQIRTDERDQALAQLTDMARQRDAAIDDVERLQAGSTGTTGHLLRIANGLRNTLVNATDEIERLQTEAKGAVSIIAGFEMSSIEQRAKIEQLTAERDEAWATIARMTHDAGDWTITAAASELEREPDAPRLLGEPCPDSCGGQPWSWVGTSLGRRWRCDTCGRIIPGFITHAIQAAINRRAQ